MHVFDNYFNTIIWNQLAFMSGIYQVWWWWSEIWTIDLWHDRLTSRASTMMEKLNSNWRTYPYIFTTTDHLFNFSMLWSQLGGLIGGAAVSWLVGPAWTYDYTTKDGRKVFVDKAPIYLFNRKNARWLNRRYIKNVILDVQRFKLLMYWRILCIFGWNVQNQHFNIAYTSIRKHN